MANYLTGDFEAVLQVSDGTINRLLATMHQNSFANPTLPSFPHQVWMRIGDPYAIDGVRGKVQAQLSTPLIQLIEGATDRFRIFVGVRARYKADPGTTPLAEYISGTVKAEYQIQDIDPQCLGWSKKAASYIWFRVVKDTVLFTGTAEDDIDLSKVVVHPGAAATDPAVTIQRINTQIAALLATRFAPVPHPVSKHFRRGSMRSLNNGVGGAAVALPVGLSGEPAGQITSISRVLAAGADVALAISVDYVMSVINAQLDPIGNFSTDVPVHVSTPWPAPDIDTVYHVHVNAPTAEWKPQGSFAIIKIKISGSAETNSVLANATFDVDQDMTLNFDGGTGRMWLSAGSRTVNTHASGLGAGTVSDAVNGAVDAAVKAGVSAACAQAQPQLDAMSSRTAELVTQLRTLDDQANVRFDGAEFSTDGIVLRGVISLSSRHGVSVQFEKTPEQDGFTAYPSWFPGGRIDSLEWSWTWSGQQNPGNATYQDRFLLRRPPGTVGRWGVALGSALPLPGLDGAGTMCLRVRGAQVDPVTGNMVGVDSSSRCHRYGLRVVTTVDHVVLRDVPQLSRRVRFPQLAVVRPDAPQSTPSNTLLIYVGEKWDERVAESFKSGLAACRRVDAGLVVLVLFKEGVLAQNGARIAQQIEDIATDVGLPAMINEDVGGRWSASLAMQGGAQGWRLLAPNGSLTWTHDGHVSAEVLSRALDDHLVASPPPAPGLIRPAIEVGAPVSVAGVLAGLAAVETNCPPPPVSPLGVKPTVITFVQRDAASETHLRNLSHEFSQGSDTPQVIVVVDGADAREADSFKNQLGLDFTSIGDQARAITRQAGISVWPTTLTVDRMGRVADIEMGVREANDRLSAS